MSGAERDKTIQIEVPIPTRDGQSVAETLKVAVPGRIDPDTGDQFLGAGALKIIDKIKARRMGLLPPEEIRSLRQSLGLTQVEMSALLQLGAKTITRWESGGERPTQSLNILLIALREGRLTPDYLRSLGGRRRIRDERGDAVEYEVIAENDSINRMIHRCFEIILPEDVPRFRKKFKDQPHDRDQVLHTFRELLLGAYLRVSGHDARYDRKHGVSTPDWTILGPDGEVRALVELTNFHLDKATEDMVKKEMSAGRAAFHWGIGHVPRLRRRLRAKAAKYQELASGHDAAYVIAVFGDFLSALRDRQVTECLTGQEGIFATHRELAGVLFFDESGGGYRFWYSGNDDADQRFDLPAGHIARRGPEFFFPHPGAAMEGIDMGNVKSFAPEEVLRPEFLERYDWQRTLVWEHLVDLNTNLFILERLAAFPFDLFAPGESLFWGTVGQSLYEGCVMASWRLVGQDEGGDCLTLHRFRSEVVRNLVDTKARDALRKRLGKIRASSDLRRVTEAIRDLRHRRLAHVLDARADAKWEMIQPTLVGLQKARDWLNAMFDALTFDATHAMLPAEYDPAVVRSANEDSRPDVERLLDAIAWRSEILNMPERQPKIWYWRLQQLKDGELEQLSKYRRKFRLSEV